MGEVHRRTRCIKRVGGDVAHGVDGTGGVEKKGMMEAAAGLDNREG